MKDLFPGELLSQDSSLGENNVSDGPRPDIRFPDSIGPDILPDTTQPCSVLTASVVACITETWSDTSATYNRLSPASASFSTSITVPQDQGYIIDLSRCGQKPSGAILEVSLWQPASGTWGAWTTFAKTSGSSVTTDTNGRAEVDFVDFGKPKEPSLGVHEAKFRIQGTIIESNSISVTVVSPTTSPYFLFNSGNYWVFKGCLGLKQDDLISNASCTPTNSYQVRFDVEETQGISIDSSSLTPAMPAHSIIANPLRVSMSPNTPETWTGGAYDFTWFLSSSFDSFGSVTAKWALKTVFYDRSAGNRLTKNRLRTAVFLRQNDSWPAYFTIANPFDLKSDLVVPNQSFNTFMTYCTNYIEGWIGYGMPCPLKPDQGISPSTGWNTAYQMVRVNFPRFKGRALRIRFWEYDTENGTISSFQNASAWNYDEWFFAEKIGLVGINNKWGRGNLCSADADCNNSTVKMQSPTFSIALEDSLLVAEQSGFVACVSLNPDPSSNSSTIALNPGGTYYIMLKNAAGKPYSGFFEYTTGSSTPSIFQDITPAPVWMENGIGTVVTGVNQPKGDYSVQLRPYIFSDIRLQSANNLPWSNFITVTLQ